MANQTLAISFVLGPDGSTLDMSAIDGDPGFILSQCFSTNTKRPQFLARLFGLPNLIAEGVNNNDTTPVALELVDLTDQGVTFPANTFRTIRWRHWVQTDNDRFFVEYERDVLGGTTPVLLPRRVVRSHGRVDTATVAYGQVHAQSTYAQDTATAVAANSSSGSSLGNNSTATITLTHPVARAAPKYVVGINASSDADTATEHLHVSAYAAGGTATTMLLYCADLATPGQDGFDDVGVLDAEIFILPPGDADLVMNSNNVELQVTGIASDETRHRVEIFIGPAVQVAFQGAA